VIFGQERANIETLSALQSLGCKVLCLVRPEDWPELQLLRSHLDRRGLRWEHVSYIDYPQRGWIVRTLLTNPFILIKGNIQFANIVARFKPTHIHLFNPFYFIAMAGGLALVRVPVIYRCGDKPILHSIFYRSIWALVKRRVALFVADSRFIERKLSESGVAGDRIEVIYAPAPEHFPNGAELPAAAVGDGVFRFVYVGQISEHKGVGLLVAAFSAIAQRHPQAHLLLAGPITDWVGDKWARDLRDSVDAQPGIRDRVHFLGFIEDIPALMKQCHAHVIPSICQEPYGLVTLEAKKCGLPTIGFDDGALTELVKNSAEGLVVAHGSRDGLAEAMTLYLEFPQVAKAHGEGAAASLSRLHVDRYGEKWLDVYQRTALDA
jgi:glycosyltransferase involved in cell wall biosynthesis